MSSPSMLADHASGAPTTNCRWNGVLPTLVISTVISRSCPVVNNGTASRSHATCSFVATSKPTVVVSSMPPSLRITVNEGSDMGAMSRSITRLHTTGETSPFPTGSTGVQSPNRPASNRRLALGFQTVSASLLNNHVNFRFSPEGCVPEPWGLVNVVPS